MLRIPQNNGSITSKLIALAILVIISFVASLFVLGVVQERESRQTDAIGKTSEQWSNSQLISGPVLTVPVESVVVTAAGEPMVNTSTLVLLPKELQYDAEIVSQVLTRGIYDIPVYTATVHGSGSFDLSAAEQTLTEGTKVLWHKAVVSVNISDTRGIVSTFDISWNDTSYQFMPASEFTLLDESGVHAVVSVDPTQPKHSFDFVMPLKGSEKVMFLPLGENTKLSMSSDWVAPSFQGAFLPTERSLTADGFSAEWEVASYGKNLPQSWVSGESVVNEELLLSKSFGVSLFEEVGFYTMVDRSAKYAILFICLTFLTFFLYEVLSGLRIHPVQYLLVGFALALFYLLLLSFSEVIGFLPAYFTSVLATTTLVTGYSFSVLHAKGRAFSITALLLTLYTYLYILLQLESLSLLFGSVLLFAVLAITMYITRNLDWYSLKN